MDFKEWMEKHYPDETEEIQYKMSHAWAAGSVRDYFRDSTKCKHNSTKCKHKWYNPNIPGVCDYCVYCGIDRR